MKRKLLLISVAALLLVGWFLYQLFGPSSKVELGRETTYITEPLAEDGLPDYALAILQRQRERVTPENNGALPFWRAMGRYNGYPREAFKLLCLEISLEDSDFYTPLVVLSDQDLVDTLACELDPGVTGTPGQEISREQEVIAEKRIDGAAIRPWIAQDSPGLAEWVVTNDKALDLLVDAADKPRFFSPSTTTLETPDAAIMQMELNYAMAMREAAKALLIRSMFEAGNGELTSAWEDCFAVLKLSEHVDGGVCLVEKLVCYKMRGLANRAAVSILDQEALTAELAHRILTNLQQFESRDNMAEVLNSFERMTYLDYALRVSTGRLGGAEEFDDSTVWWIKAAVDPNVILQNGNAWFDRIVEASKIVDRDERKLAYDSVTADITSLTNNLRSNPSRTLLSQRIRSEKIGQILISLLLPSTDAALNAFETDCVQLELTRIAAALAIYRIEHGEYPEKLTALTPEILKQLPDDLYSGKPFVYERRGEGYLLYSVGRNEQDDQGTDAENRSEEAPWVVLKGEWVSGQDYRQMFDQRYENDEPLDELEGDDLVIRLPLPE